MMAPRPAIYMPGEPNLEVVAAIDRGVIPFTRSCQNNGMCLNRELLWDLSAYIEKEMEGLSEQITEHIPQSMLDEFTSESLAIDDFNIDSPEQIASLLFRHLRVGAGVELETTKSGDRISTGKKQLERIKKDHAVIPLILQRRELAKLKSTYTSTLPELAIYEPRIDRYKLYYQIGLTFTSTGRMTCSRLHQIPIRSELGRKIRQAFEAEPGNVLISIDFSGLEMRAMAHRAKERKMIQIFNDPDGDIHATTQAGLDMPDTLDKIQKRLAAKRCGFGILYGTTDLGLWLTLQSDGVPCTREQCAGFMLGFFATYEDVPPYINQQFYRARRYGFAYNPFGRVSPAPEFRSVHKRIVREGERRIQNWSIQSFATDIFKIAAAEVYDFCVEVEKGLFGSPKVLRPLLPIHDQIILESSADIAEEAMEAIGSIMSNCVSLRVPLRTDGSISERWEK
jgi:DNA polymerase I